jgi:hypothetical protein
MERWPLEDAPLRPNAADTASAQPEWTGTLVAEWVDNGLSPAQLKAWEQAPAVVAILVLSCVGFYLTAARVALAFVYVGAMAALYFAPLVAARVRGRQPVVVTLTLGDGVLRLTRRSGTATETTELSRDEAGTLDWQRSGKERNWITLTDREGHVRCRLPDRTVKVTAWPFGTEAAEWAVDSRKLPLAVLLGSWWPGRRASTATRGSWLFKRDVDLGWDQPDLRDFVGNRARRDVVEALVVLPTAVFMWLCVPWAFASGQATNVPWIPVWTLFAVIAALMAAYGALKLVSGLRGLGRAGIHGPAAIARVILKRDG